jgi:hypothetical protein
MEHRRHLSGERAVEGSRQLGGAFDPLAVTAERPGDPGDATVMPGILRAEMFRGSHSELLVDVGHHMLRVRNSQSQALVEGSAVFVVAGSGALCLLPHSEAPTAEPTTIFDRESS